MVFRCFFNIIEFFKFFGVINVHKYACFVDHDLKGQWHEMFCFDFFATNPFFGLQGTPGMTVSHRTSYSPRYSNFKVV
jgi:hypothetical protein